MKKRKVPTEDFIEFLIATPVNATAIEGKRTNQVGSGEPLDPVLSGNWVSHKYEEIDFQNLNPVP